MRRARAAAETVDCSLLTVTSPPPSFLLSVWRCVSSARPPRPNCRVAFVQASHLQARTGSGP